MVQVCDKSELLTSAFKMEGKKRTRAPQSPSKACLDKRRPPTMPLLLKMPPPPPINTILETSPLRDGHLGNAHLSKPHCPSLLIGVLPLPTAMLDTKRREGGPSLAQKHVSPTSETPMLALAYVRSE